MELDNGNTIAAIEAVLFIYGEPIKIKKLADLLEKDEEMIKTSLAELSENLKSDKRGLSLMILEDKVALTTKSELHDVVKKIVKEELDSDLSPASLETLAIIAYLAPVARHEIDYIRGVNSSFILRNLMVRGLVQKEAAKDERGNTLYSVTFDFLKHIGLNSQGELPDFAKYRELARNFSNNNLNDKAESQPDQTQTQPQA